MVYCENPLEEATNTAAFHWCHKGILYMKQQQQRKIIISNIIHFNIEVLYGKYKEIRKKHLPALFLVIIQPEKSVVLYCWFIYVHHHWRTKSLLWFHFISTVFPKVCTSMIIDWLILTLFTLFKETNLFSADPSLHFWFNLKEKLFNGFRCVFTWYLEINICNQDMNTVVMQLWKQ